MSKSDNNIETFLRYRLDSRLRGNDGVGLASPFFGVIFARYQIKGVNRGGNPGNLQDTLVVRCGGLQNF